MDEKEKGLEKRTEEGAVSSVLHCNIEGCKAQMSPELADLPSLEVIREKLEERFVRPEDLPRFAICKGCGYKARRMGAKTYRYADTFEELERRVQEHAVRSQERDAIKGFFKIRDALNGDGDRGEKWSGKRRQKKEKRYDYLPTSERNRGDNS